MTDLVYGRAAPIYRQHGWQGPLPLPEGAKAHPPAGYTGATGIWPTDAQIADWCEQLPNGNIALRLPEGVIGIDIDAYLDKHGDVSLLALEASLGTLPATWRSTSREVLRKSGIYLFRVPPGRYHDKPAPNIEVIQHHHRYVVVMPSIHPEGRPYFWYDATDTEQRRPPRIEELAVLPEAWVEHLREKPRAEGEQREHRHHAVDDWTPAVTKAFTRALMEMAGGRHDATLTAVMALARLDRLEHPGAGAAMGELGQRFRAAIADRSTPKQADKEWADMVDGAYEIADSTPATSPKWDSTWKPGADPNWQPWWDDKEAPAPPGDPGQPRVGGLIDWPAFWTGEHAEQDWLIEPLLARGRAHALYAPAKAGKSLLALEIAAAAATGRSVLNQAPAAPMVVLYLDFEMTENDLHERLVDLGYGPDDDLSHFHYHLLPSLPPLDTADGGMLVVGEAERIGAQLVIIDTVARVISGEESKSDTFIGLARHTMTPLKRRGITVLRIDHAGKDLEKGQRNSSAKNDDVDVVWQLTVVENGVTVKATHRRLSWVPEVVNLIRRSEPLTHEATPIVWPAGTAEAARKLDELGAPRDISTRAAQALIGGKRLIVVAACRYRRTWEPDARTTQGTTTGTTTRNHQDTDPSEQPEPSPEPAGTVGPDNGEPSGTSIRGTEVPNPQPNLDRWDTEEF